MPHNLLHVIIMHQSYPVCPEEPPVPEPSHLYEALSHKHSRIHHTLSDTETGSLAPSGNKYILHYLFWQRHPDQHTGWGDKCEYRYMWIYMCQLVGSWPSGYLVKHCSFPDHMSSSFLPDMLDPAAHYVAPWLWQYFGCRAEAALMFSLQGHKNNAQCSDFLLCVSLFSP